MLEIFKKRYCFQNIGELCFSITMQAHIIAAQVSIYFFYALISFHGKITSKLHTYVHIKKWNKKSEYFSFSKPTVNASTLSFLLNHSNKKIKLAIKLATTKRSDWVMPTTKYIQQNVPQGSYVLTLTSKSHYLDPPTKKKKYFFICFLEESRTPYFFSRFTDL